MDKRKRNAQFHEEPERRDARALRGSAEFGAMRDQATRARIISAHEQERAFKRAKRHSIFVKLMKWSLPMINIIVVIGFIVWVTEQKPAESNEEIQIKEASFKQQELVMLNPNLNGYSDDRAYQVIAARATQKADKPNIINLEQVDARITDEKKQWMTVTSRTGRFDQDKEYLDLKGAVDVNSSLGYQLKTEVVNVRMKKGWLQTRTPVEITSKDIRLTAKRLTAFNNGEHVTFKGNVRLHISAEAANGKSAETKEKSQ
ncbi:LPS export ABC transporter periplasmic protein LptC [uncultured Cohaesibacter sp.]|uniref:LPS export ABC transporter periplasmic protein LptC n=1 Tax=uncultured Cohaesibacter sp. TaxID=1002546 RepID=UPI00292F0177|nr:LPS export ABC transporter periplasmic protein LptC [uncultured Cohaesibacter sp.]